MKTLYVDVYFLINFTVDLLSLHLASRFTKIPISPIRIISGGILGGIYAVVLVFLSLNPLFFSLLSVAFGFLIVLCCTKGCGFLRKIKFTAAFLFFEIVIGGIVYFSYGFLDRIMEGKLVGEATTDRNLLILSLVVLLSIGVLKIFISMFANTFSEKNAKILVTLLGKEYAVDAFVDTGNLVRDPLDLSPVMLINKKISEKIFKEDIPNTLSVNKLPSEMKGKFRIVPISTSAGSKTLPAFKADSVFVVRKKRTERINVTIAIDEEGESYGGYDALISASALDNIR